MSKSASSIPQWITHFIRSNNSLVMQAVGAIKKGDGTSFEAVARKASQSDLAKHIATMASTSRAHFDALTLRASAAGNAGEFTKGILLIALGIGSLLAAQGALLLTIVGIVLLLIGVVSAWDGLTTQALEKMWKTTSFDF